MTTSLSALLLRDLDRLQTEINSFKQEDNLWKTLPGISNTAGNLTLHLLGNLNHFVGALLGKTGYQRQREAEFSNKNVAVSEISKAIAELKPVLQNTLSALSGTDLAANFPVEHQNKVVSSEWMLIHLSGHLNYHLGQINYLRRILEA